MRTDRQTDRRTGGQTARGTDIQTNRQTDHATSATLGCIFELNSESSGVYQVTVGGDRTSLEIDEAMAEDSGDYSVLAHNAAGHARTCCSVHVIGSSALPRQPDDAAVASDGTAREICPPGFTSVFDDVTADVGRPCTVRVTVSGNPRPKVSISSYALPSFNFYRAMLSIRGTSHGPVSVSVCVRLSQVGVLSKGMNESGCFWHGSFIRHILHCVIRKLMYL